MAVPPNLVDFVESAGVSAVAYGPDTREQIVAVADFTHNAFKVQNPINFVRAGRELFVEGWAEMSRTLTALADGADLLLTGQTYHGVVANVAEYHDIPVAGLHHFPVRVNGQIGLPFLPSPAPVVRTTLKAGWRLYSQITKSEEDAQRRELGLPGPRSPRRNGWPTAAYSRSRPTTKRCFRGWRPNGMAGARSSARCRWSWPRTATMMSPPGSPRENPDLLRFWQHAGQVPAETVAMIADACAELGERALIYSGADGSGPVPHADHVRLVGQVNYATILPTCQAAVHHGGAGTTAAGLRAGLPTLILWDVADQFIWATQVKRLKVGSAKRLSTITRRSLVAKLREILAPECVARARDIAPRMTKPAVGVATAADLLERAVRVGV